MSEHTKIEDANRKHWDGRAQDYDAKPWQKKLIAEVYGQLVEHRDMFGLSKSGEGKQDFKLLDYACGPGTVTRALAPYTTKTQGIDVSDGMVAEYNRRSVEAGTGETASAVQGNLLAEEPYITDTTSGEKSTSFDADGKFLDFDAAIVGLGFHHFHDFAGALKGLAKRVKTGGAVGIIDLLPSEMHWKHVDAEGRKMMHRSGFTEEDMKGFMSEAGLTDFAWVLLPEPVTMVMKDGEEVTRRVFFASGKVTEPRESGRI